MNKFEVTVYEHAEHWTFFEVVEAESAEQAMAAARKNFGKGYSIRGAHQVSWNE